MRTSNETSGDARGPGDGPRKAHAILFACDGKSDVSMPFAVAANIAKAQGASLHCICIVERLPIATDLIMEDTFGEDCAVCAGRLSALDIAAADAGIRIEVETVFGSPHEQIAEQVRKHRIDLLILPVLPDGIVSRLQQRLVLHGMPDMTIVTVDESGQFSLTA
jgi:hypothetical protein